MFILGIQATPSRFTLVSMIDGTNESNRTFNFEKEELISSIFPSQPEVRREKNHSGDVFAKRTGVDYEQYS